MTDIYKKLQEGINSKNISKDEPMSKHTSFKIGGIADYFIKITSTDELKFLLELSKKEKIPIQIVGNGTNLLVLESGIRGFVVKLEFNSFKIERNKNEAYITVQSGFPLSRLSKIALNEELEGLEFLSGIPGTIGGAIRMNAGAYGKEMKDIVITTKYMNYEGKIKKLNLKEHEFEYRNSVFSRNNFIILETTVRANFGNKEDITNKINEYSKSRIQNQPLEYPNAGSTFKRMDDAITAKLIDECGLKGYSIGDAQVSTKHAGFIINNGKATSDDVLQLIEYVKAKIKEKFNKELELEILILGKE